MTYEAILFDLDGTLIDHYQAAETALAEWSILSGETPDTKRWFQIEDRWFAAYERGEISHQEQRRKRVREYFANADISDTQADEMFAGFLDLYATKWRAYTDAQSAIERALATGAKVGILTNGAQHLQQQKLERVGLALPGVTLLSSDELGFPKPDPRCYEAALQRLGVSASKTIMVGDNYANDVQGAVSSGITARHLDRRRGQTLDHYPPRVPKLVVCDMDGTLLDTDGKIPPGFEHQLDRMDELGVIFVPASGRQYATLHTMFPRASTLIAENGNVLVHGGEIIYSTSLDRGKVQEIIDAARAADQRVSIVYCAPDIAYIEDNSPDFLAEVDKYYVSRKVVDSLDDVDATCVKVALYTFGNSETFPLPELGPDVVGTISSPHWIDVMDASINKGVALERLQQELGISKDRTAAFGDYLNDLEMIWEAELSYAMDNAHPILASAAKWRAPGNDKHGVLTVLDGLL
ncbi:MAG: Cof-type HAD-IIB family hydrolase [Corynebacterium sp.]|nr:Cof-type HAD-IIB family hydrolase [Corynebacterium sp.]